MNIHLKLSRPIPSNIAIVSVQTTCTFPPSVDFDALYALYLQQQNGGAPVAKPALGTDVGSSSTGLHNIDEMSDDNDLSSLRRRLFEHGSHGGEAESKPNPAPSQQAQIPRVTVQDDSMESVGPENDGIMSSTVLQEKEVLCCTVLEGQTQQWADPDFTAITPEDPDLTAIEKSTPVKARPTTFDGLSLSPVPLHEIPDTAPTTPVSVVGSSAVATVIDSSMVRKENALLRALDGLDLGSSKDRVKLQSVVRNVLPGRSPRKLSSAHRRSPYKLPHSPRRQRRTERDGTEYFHSVVCLTLP